MRAARNTSFTIGRPVLWFGFGVCLFVFLKKIHTTHTMSNVKANSWNDFFQSGFWPFCSLKPFLRSSCRSPYPPPAADARGLCFCTRGGTTARGGFPGRQTGPWVASPTYRLYRHCPLHRCLRTRWPLVVLVTSGEDNPKGTAVNAAGSDTPPYLDVGNRSCSSSRRWPDLTLLGTNMSLNTSIIKRITRK